MAVVFRCLICWICLRNHAHNAIANGLFSFYICLSLDPTITCGTGTVSCLNKAGCILPSQLCDKHADCSDSSDENYCGGGSVGTGRKR